MPRYKDRPLRWPDVLGRFEAGSYTRHLHNARGLIERIRDDGSQIFDKEPKLLHKWQDYCSVLLTFLAELWKRHNLKQNLETAMREFIHEFEHFTEHTEKLLYKISPDLNANEDVRNARILIDVAYRASTYALVSAWIPDKQGERKEISVPKKYRKNAKLI